MNNLEQPKIDIEKINEAANKAAEKAYLNAIEDYYTGYDSPYKKMINEELKKQTFKYPIFVPDLLAEINQGLKNEVDKIANEAVANTYIPMVSEVLLRTDKHQKLSDILKLIVEELYEEGDSIDDYSFSYKKNNGSSDWLNCELSTPDNFYEFTLFTVHYNLKEGETQKYQILSLPDTKDSKSRYKNTMTLIKDDVKIEMPFTPNILDDKILRIFCNLMLSKCEIDIDCNEFDEDMFPQDECSCY